MTNKKIKVGKKLEWIDHHLQLSIEAVGIFAPILFISFHLLRPFLFLPIILICIIGGVIFGTLAGTFYSIIGITISCIVFYGIIQKLPRTLKVFSRYKQKFIGKHTQLTTAQVTLLRLIPFIHFHALSLFLIETSNDFREYTKVSLFSSIPLAIVYTTIGRWLSELSPWQIASIILLFLPLLYALRHKYKTIKWDDFFQVN